MGGGIEGLRDAVVGLINSNVLYLGTGARTNGWCRHTIDI